MLIPTVAGSDTELGLPLLVTILRMLTKYQVGAHDRLAVNDVRVT